MTLEEYKEKCHIREAVAGYVHFVHTLRSCGDDVLNDRSACLEFKYPKNRSDECSRIHLDRSTINGLIQFFDNQIAEANRKIRDGINIETLSAADEIYQEMSHAARMLTFYRIRPRVCR